MITNPLQKLVFLLIICWSRTAIGMNFLNKLKFLYNLRWFEKEIYDTLHIKMKRYGMNVRDTSLKNGKTDGIYQYRNNLSSVA